MSRRWVTVPIPLLRGEDTASAPWATGRPLRLENGLLTGDGAVAQVGDWLVADTCEDLSGPAEVDAVCGGGPFATQGGASAASAAVALSFDASANALFLHQIGEDRTILRTLAAYTSYTEAAPPQVTCFEFFGKFLLCIDGREAAASRKGLAIFDPASTGTFTVASVDVVAGGTGAAALRFKGIAKHQGGTVIGWGYMSEETGEVDAPDVLRGSRYGATDLDADASWQVDDTDTGPWAVSVGTLGLPIIACTSAGPATIIGKASEVFALRGDYSAQLGYTYIGSHGPLSVTGMASTGPVAAWLTARGPAVSVNGGQVQLLGVDRITRRMLTYFDLSYACAAHHREENRIVWLCRRTSTLTGAPLSAAWGDELFVWDYARDEFSVQQTPTTCFCVFTGEGPGITLAAPAGAPANLASSPTSNSAALSWDHSSGDPSAMVSVEYKLASASTYNVVGPTAVGATTWLLSGLTPDATYDWRLRYFKNGQPGSYTSVVQFTTAVLSDVATPTGLTGAVTSTYVYGGKTYAVATIQWATTEHASGAVTDLFEGTTSSFATASLLNTVAVSVVETTTERLVESPAVTRYYWVRHRLVDGTLGTAAGPVSITFSGLA